MKLRIDVEDVWKGDSCGLWSEEERKRWILALVFGTVALYAVRTAVPLCAVPMARDLSWDKQVSGSVMSSFFWGYMATQIVGGWLSDRFGGEVVLGNAAVGWSFCTLVIPLISYFPTLFISPTGAIIISRVVTGLLQGLHYPSMSSLIARRVPVKDRTFTTSMAFASGPVGTLFSGIFGSSILTHLGWPSVFIVFGLCGLLWVGLWRWLLLKHQTSVSYKRKEELSLGNIKMRDSSTSVVPWALFIKHHSVWALILTHFCASVCFWNLFSWLPTFFQENYPGRERWSYNVLPWLVFFPVSTGAGRAADCMIKSGLSVTFVRKLFQTLAMCIPALCLLLMDWIHNFSGAVSCMMLAVGSCAFVNSGVNVTPQDMAPKYAGSLFGLMNCAGAFAGLVGVYLSGYLLNITGSWSYVFRLNSVVLLFGCGIFLVLGTAKKIT